MSEESQEKQPENRSIFEELKQIRLKKKIDLQTISEKSKINLKYLEAIESGNLEEVPEVYDKLFFQTYLSYLKIRNSEHYLDEYRKLRKSVAPELTTTVKKIKSIKSDGRKLTQIKQLYLIIPVIIVGLFIIILAINSEMVTGNKSDLVKEISIQEVIEELDPKQTDRSTLINEDITDIADRSAVIVKLATLDLTWLRCVKDRRDTTEYLLKRGDDVSFQADSLLSFLVGNAGGVRFNVNGADAGILGNVGEVITSLRINKDGIADLRLKTIQNKEQSNDSLRVD
jgi:cytoskeletal protein RodZ